MQRMTMLCEASTQGNGSGTPGEITKPTGQPEESAVFCVLGKKEVSARKKKGNESEPGDAVGQSSFGSLHGAHVRGGSADEEEREGSMVNGTEDWGWK